MKAYFGPYGDYFVFVFNLKELRTGENQLHKTRFYPISIPSSGGFPSKIISLHSIMTPCCASRMLIQRLWPFFVTKAVYQLIDAAQSKEGGSYFRSQQSLGFLEENKWKPRTGSRQKQTLIFSFNLKHKVGIVLMINNPSK